MSKKDGQSFIIDGQQRLTSITLLLIYLNNLQSDYEEFVDVSPLIFSEKFGKKSFNLDVPERVDVIEALYNNQSYDLTNKSESIQTIIARYNDIQELFPDELKENALSYFIDWLIECVDFVEITAFSDDEAYTIFETTNDRGLSLSPTDMLKGFILANIYGESDKARIDQLWKKHLQNFSSIGKDDQSDFFKAWLRAKYALTIRGSGRGLENLDFDKIGTTFHKWVREERQKIGLKSQADYRSFIVRDFDFFATQYARLRQAAISFGYAKEHQLEYVHFNANNGYTLQYPLILSPLNPADEPDTIDRKIRIVSGYLDIFIARRFVNFKTISSQATKARIFDWILKIRDLDLHSLANFFYEKLAEMDEQKETFESVTSFYMHQQNRQRVHHLLARMTYALDQWTGIDSSFDTYSSSKVKTPYEIEHIWAAKYERHKDEFRSETEFLLYRNRFGGLILLPREFNQSLNADRYADKVEHYIKANLLAQSLNPLAYDKNPAFMKFIERTGLPFRPHYPDFKSVDLDGRQELYGRICEEIWSPARLERELA